MQINAIWLYYNELSFICCILLLAALIVFYPFTGLSWTDMANLTRANLQTSFDGHLWLNTNRQKTGVETNIRLLDVAKHIIEKYRDMAPDGKLLPVPCYNNCKNSIKAIAKRCDIEKNVTWHTARQQQYSSLLKMNSLQMLAC